MLAIDYIHPHHPIVRGTLPLDGRKKQSNLTQFEKKKNYKNYNVKKKDSVLPLTVQCFKNVSPIHLADQ